MGYTVGIVVFEDAEELDFVGPWEVFTMAAQANGSDRVVLLAERAEPVRCAKGMRVAPDHVLEEAPPLDVVLVPGGMGTRREMDNPRLLAWLRDVGARCKWVTSVCTGSLVLHRAGFLEGRKATTHWSVLDALRELGNVEVLENRRYVRDGNVITAAGVSAGIDMALWLVGQMYDPDFARGVQRFMEYDPAPPYSAAV